jgi:hypothetical protein
MSHQFPMEQDLDFLFTTVHWDPMGLDQHFAMDATFAAHNLSPVATQIPMEAPQFFPHLPTVDFGLAPTYLTLQAAAVATKNFEYRSSISGSSSSADTPYSYDYDSSMALQTTRSNSVASSFNSEASITMHHELPTLKTEPPSPQPSPAPQAAKNGEEETPRQKIRRHRKKFSPLQKVETHMTRLEGACLRCWRNRKRVCFERSRMLSCDVPADNKQ